VLNDSHEPADERPDSAGMAALFKHPLTRQDGLACANHYADVISRPAANIDSLGNAHKCGRHGGGPSAGVWGPCQLKVGIHPPLSTL